MGDTGVGSTSGAWVYYGIQKGAPHSDLRRSHRVHCPTGCELTRSATNYGGALSPIQEVDGRIMTE